jgi:putative transposase
MNRLSNGQELRDPRTDQPVWRVINAMPIDQGIKLYSFSEKTEKYVSLRKIHDSIIASDLVVYDHRQAKIPLVDQQAPKLIKQLQVANAHLCAIDEMQRSADITTKRAWSILYDEHIRSGGEPEAFPGLSTTYRYIERRRHNLGLVKGDANKGNRTHRYSEEVQALAIKIIQENYLKEGSSDTRKTILREVNDEVKALGLLPGGKEVGKKYLASLIRMMTMDEEVHRMDPKNVLSARSRGTQRLKVSSVFQRYEQDALHLPFVVKTAHGISSNVWVVHAIDCGASMPVSWKMVIGNPRETDTMKCIERFLYSKRDLFLGLGINANWDCEGTPAMLIFDNGSENKGDRVEQLPRLNMGVMHCKARAGHGKPFIERLNRSLKEGLERLPGCTRMHGKDGTRDPVKLEDKLMSVEELEKWLVNWYYKVWANLHESQATPRMMKETRGWRCRG